jgi:FMN phosphatase YigB (HAD superfamily)
VRGSFLNDLHTTSDADRDMQPGIIRVLLFDLGGVLLDLSGVESVWALSKGQVDRSTFSDFWSRSEWAERFNCGLCSPEEFACGAVKELGLLVTPRELLGAFSTWLRGPFPGAFELLDELRGRYTLACLSNTNELDVRRLREEFQIHTRLDYCFFSNEIGRRKPHRHCYDFVIDRLAVKPNEIAFFDDNPECVAGAEAAGFMARRCEGIEATRASLKALRLLSS